MNPDPNEPGPAAPWPQPIKPPEAPGSDALSPDIAMILGLLEDEADRAGADRPADGFKPEPGTLATPAVDPWAHRRGEPRVFAFFWTLYVLLAVAGSLTWVAKFTTITASSYGPAARIMLVVLAVGMIVLWPMTRLSQTKPEAHPVTSSLADLLVVLVPVQIVIWPLMILASWPRDIVVGLAAMFAAWGVATGGLVALGLAGAPDDARAGPRVWGRAAWMIIAIGLGFGAVLAQWALAARGVPVPAWLLMSSPVSAIAALTGRGLAGPSAPVSAAQWDAIVGTLSVAVLLWSAAVARHGLAGRTDRA